MNGGGSVGGGGGPQYMSEDDFEDYKPTLPYYPGIYLYDILIKFGRQELNDIFCN